MKTNEITAAILSVQSMDELKVINEALGYQWKRLQQGAAKSFKVKQKVKWLSKYGRYETGEVVKVNQKTVQVRADSGVTWRVSPTLLEKVI